MRHRIVLQGSGLMLGCSLAEIGPKEVLHSTTSQPLEWVLPLNFSLGSASGRADTSEPMYLLKVDDGVRRYRCLLVKIPASDAFLGVKMAATREGRSQARAKTSRSA
jgi:hypothetical protein